MGQKLILKLYRCKGVRQRKKESTEHGIRMICEEHILFLSDPILKASKSSKLIKHETHYSITSDEAYKHKKEN